jgi:type IVB pilus formation R64 PilN family outer membrane protein
MKKSLIGCVALLVLALSGCETFQHAGETERGADADKAKIEAQLKAVAQDQDHSGDTVQYLAKQWVSLDPIDEPVPASVPHLDCGTMNIVTAEPVSIHEFAQVITKKCKIAVNVTDDALASIYNPDLLAGRSSGGATDSAHAQTQPAAPVFGQSANASIKVEDDHKIDINCKGCELDPLMDMVVARLGLSWRPDDDGRSIKIFNIDTQTYPVHLIGSDTDMRSEFESGTTQTNGVSSAQGSGSSTASTGGSGSNTTLQNTVVELKTSVWTEMKTDLETIAGKGNVSVAPSMGSVTVTASRAKLEACRKYVDAKNKLFDKFVTFNVDLISVTLANTDSAGISWNALYKTLTGKYGFNLTNTFTAPAGAISGAFSILSSSSSPWGGTQAVISALNEQGKTRLLRSTSLPTTNLNAVATETGEQDSYLQSASLSQTANVGSVTSLQPGTINTGFNISLFPYIREDNEIELRMNINLSAENGAPRTVTSGGSTIELPNISLPLNTTNTVRVKAGQTVLLAGQDYDDETSTRDGSGIAKFFGFGGGVNVTRSHTMLVVLVTPVFPKAN